MVRAFQNIYGQVRECLGPDSRRTLREGKLPAAFHRLARAIDANRALAAFVALILFGLIAGGAMFHTTSAIAAGGGGIGSPGSVVTPIAVPTDDDDRSATRAPSGLEDLPTAEVFAPDTPSPPAWCATCVRSR